jgi:hypothetical protein
LNLGFGKLVGYGVLNIYPPLTLLGVCNIEIRYALLESVTDHSRYPPPTGTKKLDEVPLNHEFRAVLRADLFHKLLPVFWLLDAFDSRE